MFLSASTYQKQDHPGIVEACAIPPCLLDDRVSFRCQRLAICAQLEAQGTGAESDRDERAHEQGRARRA